MGSLGTLRGRWRYQFRRGGRVYPIHLGVMPAAAARRAAVKFDAILAAAKIGERPGEELLGWLAGTPWAGKLPVILPREYPPLERVIERYLRELGGRVKWSTRCSVELALREVKSKNEKVVREMRSAWEGLAAATVGRRVAMVKAFFRWAGKLELAPPEVVRAAAELRGGGGGGGGGGGRQAYVPAEVIERMIASCPADRGGHDHRLMLGLARYGGLRVPSETSALRWSDINWERRRMVITSRKTEHVGKGARVLAVPANLLRMLEAGFAAATPGAKWVIGDVGGMQSARWRSRSWIAYRFGMIRDRAGVQPWPKLWNNLRASFLTDLVARTRDIQMATRLAGNTPGVAMAHYLQVTEAALDAVCELDLSR